MAGCLDIALEWGRGNALVELTGDTWVDDLSEGESRLVYVAHVSTPLAIAEIPVINVEDGDAEGLTIEPVLSADVEGTARLTDQNGFIIRVTVPTGLAGTDKSRGGVESDWCIHWTRRGVLLNA